MEIRLRLIGIGLACLVLGVPSTVSAGLSRAPNNLGLVGYWSFNEGTGLKATDFSGNGNTGTLTNGPSWAGGKLGYGLRFDGTDDYVSLGSPSALNISGTITISAWVKATNTSPGTTWIVGDLDSGGTTGSQWSLEFGRTNGRFSMLSNYAAIALTNSTTISANTWYHVVGVRSGSAGSWTYTIYLNGVADGTATTATNPDAQQGVAIGRQGARSSGYFPGSIDEVRIYNRALGANEITRLYNTGSSKVQSAASEAGTGLVGHWKLDDRTGTRALDSSGSGNNGTLTNFALSGASSNWTSGRLGGAVSFDGTNDYVDAGTSATLNPPAITTSAWVKATSFPNAYNAIVGRENSGVTAYYMMSVKSNGKLAVYLTGSGGFINFDGTGTTTLVAGNWYHVVMTYDSVGGLNAYINGVLDKNVAASGTLTSITDTTFIGAHRPATYTRYFPGIIDDVRIYNRALTAEQVKTLYTSGSSRPAIANANSASLTAGTNLASGLVGHWSFDGKYLSTTVARDSSGQGNDGTLTNGPVPIMGKMGQALSFDKVNDYVTIPTIHQSGEMTASAWIKLTTTAGSLGEIISQHNGTGTGDYAFGVNRTAGKLDMVWSGSIALTSNATLLVNNWYHVTFVRSGSSGNWTAKIYIDGVLDNSATSLSFNPDGASDLTAIGTASGAPLSYLFPGSIDDVRIYNRALSAQEVKQLYYLGK